MRLFAEHPEPSYPGRGVLLLLGGVVMGTAVGLLTAPQSGERTRRHLVRGAADAKEHVAELYTDVTDKVDDLRRGMAETCAVGRKFIDNTRRELLGGSPGRQNVVRRMITALRG